MRAITLDDIHRELSPRWAYALPVVDYIERHAKNWRGYAKDLDLWLSGEESTVHFRDKIAEPIRRFAEIIEIGEQFNPTTQWSNTWMPLDTAAYIARRPTRLELKLDHSELLNLPYYGMF